MRQTQSPQQTLLQKHHRQIELVVRVAPFPKAVSLITRQHVPQRRPVAPYGFDDLFGLRARDGGIVRALKNEQRLFDLLALVERGDALEEGSGGGVALVAVFDSAEVAAIGRGGLEEG